MLLAKWLYRWGSQIKVTKPLPASPSLWQVATNWDGQWYWSVLLEGYLTELLDPGAAILQSSFAFFPGYPWFVEKVMAVGLPYPIAASLLSTVAGASAMIPLHKLLLRTIPPFSAAAGIAVLCIWPASAVLQVAYTESLALLLIVLSIGSIITRRYLWSCAFILLLGMVRPVTAPLVVVILVHAGHRLTSAERLPRSNSQDLWIGVSRDLLITS